MSTETIIKKKGGIGRLGIIKVGGITGGDDYIDPEDTGPITIEPTGTGPIAIEGHTP